MKKSVRILTVLCTIVLCQANAVPVSAVPVTPQPSANSSTPDIIATTVVADSQLKNLEIFNQTNTPINLDHWRISVTGKGDSTCTTPQTVIQPIASQWLLPKHYFTATPAQDLPTSCTRLAAIQILHSSTVIQQVIMADTTTLTTDRVYQHRQRDNSATSPRSASGNFEADYTKVVPAHQATLYSDPLYAPPTTNAGLQILEILPNARDCAPTNPDITCGDFVKVYNSTNKPINLASYRLRVGHKGQSELISNTFTWGQALDPLQDELILPAQSYFTLTTRNDGQILSLTDSGDFVWLEDAHGVTIYDPVVEYPDATSTTKIGTSWALNGNGWQWTTAPQPNGLNHFPPEAATTDSIITTDSLLKPCMENQYRSPETNRCRNLTTTASAITPCKEGQERNPETNRCRSVLANNSSEQKPCDAGEERNPETNRCRKTPVTTSAHIKDSSNQNESTNQFTWIIAVVAAIAVGYATYEWRQDIALGFSRIKGRLATIATRFKR